MPGRRPASSTVAPMTTIRKIRPMLSRPMLFADRPERRRDRGQGGAGAAVARQTRPSPVGSARATAAGAAGARRPVGADAGGAARTGGHPVAGTLVASRPPPTSHRNHGAARRGASVLVLRPRAASIVPTGPAWEHLGRSYGSPGTSDILHAPPFTRRSYTLARYTCSQPEHAPPGARGAIRPAANLVSRGRPTYDGAGASTGATRLPGRDGGTAAGAAQAILRRPECWFSTLTCRRHRMGRPAGRFEAGYHLRQLPTIMMSAGSAARQRVTEFRPRISARNRSRWMRSPD